MLRGPQCTSGTDGFETEDVVLQTCRQQGTGRYKKSFSKLTDCVLRVLNEDRGLTARDIASEFSISVSNAHNIVAYEVGFNRISA